MSEKHIQTMTGKVMSTKMQKTVIVEVVSLKQHPKYRKFIRTTKRYKAHCENPSIQEGQKVTIRAIRPMSREKRWAVVE
ncbi:MAG: 30S ribosomal protein S17 [Patescibacteria group bacterium]